MLIDLVGRTVAGFRLTSRLGEGGMSVVFAAENKLNTQIRRAIKIVLPELSSRPEFRRRFSDEANIVEKLQHPNVVRFYGLREEKVDGNDLLLMELELLEGDTLAATLDATPNPPTRDVLAWFQGAAEGVAAAHDLGIVHRDLKPANLFLTTNGTVKVLDFGIARALDEADRGGRLTRTGTLVGTAAYMAPEVCNGKEPTAAADVYSLGISLVEMLLGHHPYAAPGEGMKSTPQMMFAHVTQPIPSVRAVRPDVGSALEEIIARTTAKDPKDRFSTARELADALRAMSANPALAAQSATKFGLPLAPASIRRSGIEDRATKQTPSGPRRLRAGVMAAVAVLAIAGTVAIVVSRQPARSESSKATGSAMPVVEHAACPPGEAMTPDTDGHCCWPGQSWAGTRCIGVPTSCPDGLNRDLTVQACVANSCVQGMTLVDTTHCCWQGQAWNSARQQCVGIPASCPNGMVATSSERCEVDAAKTAGADAPSPPPVRVAAPKGDPAVAKREQEFRAKQLEIEERRQRLEEQRVADEEAERQRKDEEQAAAAAEKKRQEEAAAALAQKNAACNLCCTKNCTTEAAIMQTNCVGNQMQNITDPGILRDVQNECASQAAEQRSQCEQRQIDCRTSRGCDQLTCPYY